MPTVRTDIKPLAIFPAPVGKNEGKSLRVFPAEAWEKWGGREGRYRVMIGETWISRAGEGTSFYTWDGVIGIMNRWARPAVGLPKSPRSITPDLPLNSLVFFVARGIVTKHDEAHLASRTRCCPFQDGNGEWRVYILGCKEAVLLENLRPRKRGEGFDLKEGSDGKPL